MTASPIVFTCAPMIRGLRLDNLRERDDELDHDLISVCLRQRREARDVGE
jgi:hypothetical protein